MAISEQDTPSRMRYLRYAATTLFMLVAVALSWHSWGVYLQYRAGLAPDPNLYGAGVGESASDETMRETWQSMLDDLKATPDQRSRIDALTRDWDERSWADRRHIMDRINREVLTPTQRWMVRELLDRRRRKSQQEWMERCRRILSPEDYSALEMRYKAFEQERIERNAQSLAEEKARQRREEQTQQSAP